MPCMSAILLYTLAQTNCHAHTRVLSSQPPAGLLEEGMQGADAMSCCRDSEMPATLVNIPMAIPIAIPTKCPCPGSHHCTLPAIPLDIPMATAMMATPTAILRFVGWFSLRLAPCLAGTIHSHGCSIYFYCNSYGAALPGQPPNHFMQASTSGSLDGLG